LRPLHDRGCDLDLEGFISPENRNHQ
jgi:hypothetical protein